MPRHKLALALWILAAVVLPTALASAPARQSAGGPPGGDLFNVTVSYGRASTLFASPLRGGVYKSADAGVSWKEVDNGLGAEDACKLIGDPRAPQVVYAACHETLFKTVNGGERWTPLTALADPWREPVIAPSDSNLLYLPGRSCHQLFVSRTAGRAWTMTALQGLPDQIWQTVAVDPLDASTLYGVCGQRLFNSTDAGATWTAVTNDWPPNDEITTVRVDVGRPGTIYAGIGRRLFRSSSAGASWTAIGEFPEGVDDILTSPPASGAAIVVRSNNELFRSDDGGVRWTSIGVDLKDILISNVVMDRMSDTTLYAATSAGLFVTKDSGAQWRQARSLGLVRSAVHAMTIDGGNPATLRVSTDSGSFASADGGNTWQSAVGFAPLMTAVADRWKGSRPNGQIPEYLTVVPGEPLHAFASVGATLQPKSLWRTDDGGETWQHADDCSPFVATWGCRAIVDPNDRRVIYEITVEESAETGWETVRRSVDGGRSWEPMPTPASVWLFTVLPTKPVTTLFADLPISSNGARHTLMVSTDHGEHWTRSDRGLPPLNRVTALVIDPSRPSRLFAGTDGRGVFVSLNDGREWRPSGAAVAP